MASPEELYGDSIDQSAFEQILEMDDDEDDDREFSRSIVYGFFDQAEASFKKMDASLTDSDLPTLSSEGHFLKGSSATLGLTKVKDCCEKIQHYGARKDEQGNTDVSSSDEELLGKIKREVALARKEYAVVEVMLRRFFGED